MPVLLYVIKSSGFLNLVQLNLLPQIGGSRLSDALFYLLSYEPSQVCSQVRVMTFTVELAEEAEVCLCVLQLQLNC